MVSRLRTILPPVLCALALGVCALALGTLATSAVAEAEEAPTGLGLVYLDRSEVALGETQSIAVLAEGDAPGLVGLTLTVVRTDGSAERTLEAARIVDGAALAEFPNGDASLAGDWRVATVELRWADGTTTSTTLPDSGDLGFTLEAEAAGESEGSGGAETTYTTVDGEDGLVTTDDFGETVDEALGGDSSVTPMAIAGTASGPSVTTLRNAVVALDPGHGGSDSGAGGLGFLEKDVNWAISMATKEWLEQRGVNVFLTHAKDENGGYDESDALDNRVARAVDAGACVLVSQHNNSTPGGRGFELYIPVTSDLNPHTHDQGLALAEALAPKLRELGLNDRGIKEKYFSSSSSLDWYGVIRRARAQGLTCILVEHAFVDTESDAALLRDPDFLRRLGYADAEAIYERLDPLYRSYCDYHGIPYVEPEEEIERAVEGGVLRLYNQWSGEHLFTTDKGEAKNLVGMGWAFEGVEWVNPSAGGDVYRLYNPYTDEHLYTTEFNEYEILGGSGWQREGVKLHTADASEFDTVAVRRLFNPYNDRHIFTTSPGEYESLRQEGWQGEGVKFLGIAPPPTESETPGVPEEPEVVATPIMGQSQTSHDSLRRWFSLAMASNGKPYPELYAGLGAATPEEFVDVLWNEATIEGVRPDVLLAQVIEETGWLQFTGTVAVNQCNFGGLGATGKDNPGNSFADVRTGLRAQVQHLKAYASTEPLVNECVDVRFGYVERGCAPNVEDLTGRWASDPDYDQNIKGILARFPKDPADPS